MKISELRKQYPQYSDMSDYDLANKYHEKYYSDIPKGEFLKKVGVSQGYSSIPHDIKSSLKGVPGAAAGAIASAFSDIPSAASEFSEHPLRGGWNVAMGGVERLAEALNLPHQATEYAKSRDLAGLKNISIPELNPIPWLEKKVGSIPFVKENWPIEPQNEGERAERNLGIIPALALIKGKATGRAGNARLGGGAAAIAGGEGEDPIQAALSTLLLEKGARKTADIAGKVKNYPAKRRLKAAEEEAYHEGAGRELSAAQKAFQDALSQEKDVKFDVESQLLPTKESTLTGKKQAAIEDMNYLKEALKKPASEIPKETVEQFKAARKQKISGAESDIKSLIAPKQIEHDTVLAQEKLAPRIKAIIKEVGSEYDALEKDAKNDNAQIKNPTNAKAILDQILSEIKEGNLESEKVTSLHKELEQASAAPSLSVEDALRKYRTITSTASSVRSSAYKEGITREEHQARQEKADFLDKKAAELSAAIEEGSDAKYKERLKKINKRYASEVIPLKRNKIARHALYRGRIDVSDIPKELRGENPGNDIIRNMIASDPESAQLALAHHFAKRPKSLVSHEAVHKPYIKAVPGLDEKINALKSALEENKTTQPESKKLADVIANAKREKALQEKNQKLLMESEKKIKQYDAAISSLRKVAQDKSAATYKLEDAKSKIKKLEEEKKEEKEKYIKYFNAAKAYAHTYSTIKIILSKLI